MRRFVISFAAAAIVAAPASAEPFTSWLVQAGKNFQKAGEYTVRLSNTRVQDAIDAYGEPTDCRLVTSANHAVFTWAGRGIRIDAWTYGYLPKGENGCTSPDLIYVSEVRLTGSRWTTSLGLHVGDTTRKLRSRYPNAIYNEQRRAEYWLVTARGSCLGVCTPYEAVHGVQESRLSAQVNRGKVVALWIPVYGQGE